MIQRASLSFPTNRAQYRLPYHKTDRFYRGTDIFFISQQVADPVDLRTYTPWRDSLHGSRGFLFLRHNGQPPTRRWFDTCLFSLLDRSYGGHSARAGGATFYASLGHHPSPWPVVQWSSSTWTSYNPAVRAETQLAHLQHRPHLLSPPPDPTHTYSSTIHNSPMSSRSPRSHFSLCYIHGHCVVFFTPAFFAPKNLSTSCPIWPRLIPAHLQRLQTSSTYSIRLSLHLKRHRELSVVKLAETVDYGDASIQCGYKRMNESVQQQG
jgi:hypothetical protein